MASSSSAKGGTRWGSLLSQAVAGVEARLDTMLAETDEATKQQQQQQEKQQAKPAAAATANQPAKTSTL